jgi:ubiquinone/menaquinone biosynthesis C-methylase UbiE
MTYWLIRYPCSAPDPRRDVQEIMNSDDPKTMVENGYDDIARTYHEQRDKFKSNELLAGFSSLLPPAGDVLDVGCGAGVPVARFLVRAGFKITGVDVSSSMLELARVHVPEASFVKMDMRQLGFDAGCFDGICAFYSLFHVPREEHLKVLVGFNRLLRQGGILLFSTGSGAWEGVEDFHGARMFWSHPDREVTRQLVTDAGFAVIMSEVLEHGGEEHFWVVARKSTQPVAGMP